jgi:hypothetical protein
MSIRIPKKPKLVTTIYRVSHNTWDFNNALGRPPNDKAGKYLILKLKIMIFSFKMRYFQLSMLSLKVAAPTRFYNPMCCGTPCMW